MRAVALKPQVVDSVDLVEAPEPTISPEEVLVKTLSVGIDGTDIEINSGAYGQAPDDESLLILGHEAVGRVDAVGSAVRDFSEGELVVPTVRRAGGRERGIKQAHGFFSERFKEAPQYLVKIPVELAAVGALMEPMSVAQKAIAQAFEVQKRVAWEPKTCLVMGAGSLGIMLTVILRSKGLPTFTFDLSDETGPKALIIKKTGARYVDAKHTSLEDFSNAVAPPDLIVDATGSSKAAFSALNILAEDGVLCLLSVASGSHSGELCPDCLENQLVLGNRAMFGSVSSNRVHFEQAIETSVYAEKTWPGLLRSIITQPLDLTNFRQAFEAKDRHQIKSVVYFS